MEERKKLCLVSHCILNCNSKVEGSCKRKGPLKEVLYPLIEKDYGIIQLPCPEIDYGLRRWGHVREQFDNPFYREHCKRVLKPIMMQVMEYHNNNYTVNYVIGINGSPSCGVEFSYSSEKWGGELSKRDHLESLKEGLHYKMFPGIFMEVLIALLHEYNIRTKFLGITESKLDEYDFMTLF